ncbi:relaxase/mobilization nuclease domain-containing protein [Lacinutrix chionoecetis]
MIIKEKSIKSYIGMEKALRYVLTKGINGTGEVFRRFVLGDRPFENALASIENDMEEISMIMEKRIANMMTQFKTNDKNRLFKRKGETKFYHSILSFSKEDTLTQKQLKSVARQYAKERYPNSMVVSIPHYDKEHLHLHSLASSVEVGTGKTCYLSRKEFAGVKNRMEAWQDKTLGLKHSRINHSKKKSRSYLKMQNTK